MHWITLEQTDSWFFRTGRPMHIGETPVTKTESAFPPQAPTVVGALRAALARNRGWSGKAKESWSKELESVLGSRHDLGQLQFTGPFLCLNHQPLFPVPRHILGKPHDSPKESKRTWEPAALLAPGAPMQCDLADTPVRLPVPARIAASHSMEELKNIEDAYVTPEGMAAILRGELPGQGAVLPNDDIWLPEGRTGIRRQIDKRTTGPDALFSTVHIRLREGVTMCMGVHGVPQDWDIPQGFVPFGGEGRMAALREAQPVELPQSAFAPEGKTVALVLLTPADFTGLPLAPEHPLPTMESLRLVSACMDRPLKLGGWCSINHRPLHLTPLLPAGSVLFCEADSQNLGSILSNTPIQLGQRTEYGFGLAAAGVWPSKETQE